MSHVSETLRDDEYIGYTLHYSSPAEFHQVATHLTEKASAGGKFRFNIYLRAHENFLFVRTHKKTTMNAVQCFLRKDSVLRQCAAKVCFHKEETTVVDGLTDTMQLATDRSDCWSHSPARVESQLAVDADIASTAGSAIQWRRSDVAAGSAVKAGSEIRSLRGVVPDPDDYRGKFPVLYLTPKLIMNDSSYNDALFKRGKAYTLGSLLISSDRGDVYSVRKDGIIVSIKDLGTDALAEEKLDRTGREIFTLEKGHDRDDCCPRILDIFTQAQVGSAASMWDSKCGVSPWASFERLRPGGRTTEPAYSQIGDAHLPSSLLPPRYGRCCTYRRHVRQHHCQGAYRQSEWCDLVQARRILAPGGRVPALFYGRGISWLVVASPEVRFHFFFESMSASTLISVLLICFESVVNMLNLLV